MSSETRSNLEIKEMNTAILTQAIKVCTREIVTYLDTSLTIPFNNIADSPPISLLAPNGQKKDCSVRIGVAAIHPEKMSLRLCIREPETNTQPITLYDSSSIGTKPEELAYRLWFFYKRPKNSPHFNVVSNLKVLDAYQQSGLGTTLLKEGDALKLTIAKKVANIYQVASLINTIDDQSETGWSSRRIKQTLQGFTQIDDKLFHKVEKLD